LLGKYLVVDERRARWRSSPGRHGKKTISEAKKVTGGTQATGPRSTLSSGTVPVLLATHIPSVAENLSHGMRPQRCGGLPFDRILRAGEQRHSRSGLGGSGGPGAFPACSTRASAATKRCSKTGGHQVKRPKRCCQANKRAGCKGRRTRLPAVSKGPLPTTKAQGRCLDQDFYRAYQAWTRDRYTLTQDPANCHRTLELSFLHQGGKDPKGMAIFGLVVAHGDDD